MLKRLVVIMVVFALVTGVAFAQVTFGGQMQMGSMLFSGTNVKDSDVLFGGNYNGAYPEAKISMLLGDGTAGGRMVYTFGGQELWGWFQWRPNQYFRMKMGRDGDGEGGFPQIIGWGFTGEAKNSVAAVSDYQGGLYMAYRNSGLNYGAFDGIGAFNLQFSVFPVDMLQINFLFRDVDKPIPADERFATMQIYASYMIEEVGTVRFAAVGNGGIAKGEGNGATLHLAFHSSQLAQGLAFELGGQFNVPYKAKKDDDNLQMGAVRVAGGINLSMFDPFAVKVRFGTMFGGLSNGEPIEKTGFTLGILPSYKLPKFTIFFHAGIGLEKENKDADQQFEWFINPYIWMPLGGMRMWVGIQIVDERSKNEGQFAWKVPFGFNFYF